MKPSLSLFFLGLFACTLAEALDWQESDLDEYDDEDLDWAQIEQELEASPFIEIDTESSAIGDRKRKIISGSCKCTGNNACGCCVSQKIFGDYANGCVDFLYNNSEKNINVSVTVNQGRPLSHVLSLTRLERVCIPIPYLASFLNVCLKSSTFEDEDNGLRICSGAELRVIRATALKVDFNCINLKDGKFGFAEGKTTGKSLINISVKNPLKAVIEFIKKHKKNSSKKNN